MRRYVLEFDDDELGEPKRVEFTAESSAAALTMLEREAAFRHVKLWEDDKLLGDVMRDGQGIWHLDETH